MKRRVCSLVIVLWSTCIAAEYDIDALNAKCQELDLALMCNRNEVTGEPDAYVTYRGNAFMLPLQIFEKVYQSLMKHDPHHDEIAKVRVIDKDVMCQQEKKAAHNRDLFCQKQIEKILDQNLSGKKIPRIALCLSGGGCRSLVACAGFLNGLDKRGFLDAVHTISSLSGGTWALAPWVESSQPFSKFYPCLIERLVGGIFNSSLHEMVEEFMVAVPGLTEYFIKKFIFKDTPSLIDFYGYCLALNFSNLNLLENYTDIDLSDQQKNSDEGLFPLPLYTAIIPQKNSDEYAWLTFSPYEVSSGELKSAVPAWAYGRKFDKGVSVNKAPALSLGFLMALWGSAVSASFKEFYMMILDTLEPKALFAPLKLLAKETVMGDIRFFPANIRNYTLGSKELPMAKEKRATVIDAGLSCNVPVLPLLEADRGVDIIIIVDASGDILGAPELKIAETLAKKRNLPFPKIDYTNINKQSYSIFDDGKNSPAPIVIYVPMIKNAAYSSEFDPQDHLSLTGFMNTFSFKYSQEQAEQLAGLFEYTAGELQEDLIAAIITVLNRKNA